MNSGISNGSVYCEEMSYLSGAFIFATPDSEFSLLRDELGNPVSSAATLLSSTHQEPQARWILSGDDACAFQDSLVKFRLTRDAARREA